jgi:hypothetical protein
MTTIALKKYANVMMSQYQVEPLQNWMHGVEYINTNLFSILKPIFLIKHAPVDSLQFTTGVDVVHTCRIC